MKKTNKGSSISSIFSSLLSPDLASGFLIQAESTDSSPVPKKEVISKNKSFKAQVFEDRTILINLICMICVWVSSSFCYYLISYQLKYIKGNIYINGIISSLSEIAAYLSSGFLTTKFGMKNTLIGAYTIGIVGMAALIFYDPTGDDVN